MGEKELLRVESHLKNVEQSLQHLDEGTGVTWHGAFTADGKGFSDDSFSTIAGSTKISPRSALGATAGPSRSPRDDSVAQAARKSSRDSAAQHKTAPNRARTMPAGLSVASVPASKLFNWDM